MKKFFYLTIFLLAVAMLAGCGGSDSDDDDPTPITEKISGKAAKGIIKNGNVTAYELNSDGTVIREVGSATTDDNGEYKLVFNSSYVGGVIKVQITPLENSEMKCDTFGGCGGVSFGDWMPLPDGFSMDAVIQPKGNSVNILITPLTHMAASRVMSSGAVTAQSTANANSEVSQIVGVNIIQSEVADITDTESLEQATGVARHYALFLAGVSGLLNPDGEDETLNGNLNELADSFNDGQLDDSDDVSIDALISSVEAAIDGAANNSAIYELLEDETVILNRVIEVIEDNIVNGVYNPEPGEGAGKTEIEQAKLVLRKARTFVEQIEDNYEAPMESLDVDVQTIENIVSGDVNGMAELLDKILFQVFEHLDATTTLAKEIQDPQEYAIDITNDTGDPIGTVTVTSASDSSGLSLTLNGNIEDDHSVDIIELKIATNITSEDVDISGDIVESITSDDVQVTVSGKIGNDNASITFEDVILEAVASQSVTLDLTDDAKNRGKEQFLTSVSFNGNIKVETTDATFIGRAEISLISLNNSVEWEVVPISIKKVELDGEFTSETGRFEAGVVLNVSNADYFDTLGLLNYNKYERGHRYIAYSDFSANSATFLETKIGLCETAAGIAAGNSDYVWLSKPTNTSEAELTCSSYSSSLGGTITFIIPDYFEEDLLGDVLAEYGDSIEKVGFDLLIYAYGGSLNDAFMRVLYRVTLKDFEDASNFAKAGLIISTTATVPDMPPLSVTASVVRSSLSGGSASITISHDGTNYTISYSSNDIDNDIKLSLQNPDGVNFSINIDKDAEDVSGTVYVGNEHVGDIEKRKGLILVGYKDGTFESLF